MKFSGSCCLDEGLTLFVTDGLAVRLGSDGLRVGFIEGLFITDGLGVRLGSDGLRVGFIEGGSG